MSAGASARRDRDGLFVADFIPQLGEYLAQWHAAGLRVAVADGGLGGLCLAQGLLKAGIDAYLAVRRQGYQLHVDGGAGRGARAVPAA